MSSRSPLRGLTLCLTQFTVSGIHQDASRIGNNTAAISRKASMLDIRSTLAKLRRPNGASWDPKRVCLQNTRVEFIDRVISLIENNTEQGGTEPTQGAKIILLTAVAGAGKSTVAHTVAERFHKNSQLVSSFFFDHKEPDRKTPAALFTTIADDLSKDPGLAARIAAAIERDRSLPSAPISRQFEGLVREPCQDYPISGLQVFVIDALDEAWDQALFEILRDRANQLPSTFRIFLTSRMGPELASLCHKAHVKEIILNIDDRTNMEDMKMFVAHKLRALAEDRSLRRGWPGKKLQDEFTQKADGLFLWVTVVCEYLRYQDDPTEELRQLVSSTSSTTSTHMDDLYATILKKFNWGDRKFAASYGRVMGTTIACKVPLTISGMRQLFHERLLASNFTLQRLSPLLTGMGETEQGTQPVRVLHKSLRDFLVERSTDQFHIVEKENSAELAQLCLDILNRELGVDTSGATNLAWETQEIPGVPNVNDGTISEALWYACRFWPDHVCDANPSDKLQEALVNFMDNILTTWLKVVIVNGTCRNLAEVREWMQVSGRHV